MAYAVIELLSLNFALNPLFCKTDVMCRLSYSIRLNSNDNFRLSPATKAFILFPFFQYFINFGKSNVSFLHSNLSSCISDISNLSDLIQQGITLNSGWPGAQNSQRLFSLNAP